MRRVRIGVVRRRSVVEFNMDDARETTLPSDSLLVPAMSGADLVDAYAITLPPQASGNVIELARAVMSRPPRVLVPLMQMRNAIMRRFGVKASDEIGRDAVQQPLGAIGPFPVREVAEQEVVMGVDDSHLNFQTSMLVRPEAAGRGRELVWITVVHCNNTLGRAYLAAVRPFHRRLVPAFLNNSARHGWPVDAT